MKENTVAENLTSIFEFELPGPPDIQKNDQQLECGICYAQYLPTGNTIHVFIKRWHLTPISHSKPLSKETSIVTNAFLEASYCDLPKRLCNSGKLDCYAK